jgi:Tfp pilus assembly protein PilF
MDYAHFVLATALEKKGDPDGALEEYRAAALLDSKNPQYQASYQRLSNR